VTGRSVSAAARCAGSRASIRPVTPQTAFHCPPLTGGDLAGQARGGGGAQSRHRRELLPGGIGALAAQPCHEVLENIALR